MYARQRTMRNHPENCIDIEDGIAHTGAVVRRSSPTFELPFLNSQTWPSDESPGVFFMTEYLW